MDIKDIPHNMDFTFGPNLREVPISKIEMLYGMMHIMEQLKNGQFNQEEQGMWNGLLGVYLRIVGELDESEKHLKTAIQIYKELEQSRRVFINTLRLAHTYQWWTKFDISNQMFSELREQAESDPDLSDLLDFVYQHHGKNHFDQKEYETALSYFEKALDLRRNSQNEELIASTETAIEACEYRLEHGYK